MKLFSLLLMSLLVSFLVGCSSSSDKTSDDVSPSSPNQKPSDGQTSVEVPQPLKVWETGVLELNKVRAVNVNPGGVDFDFTYTPPQDEGLVLVNVRPTLMGCQNSNIALTFRLYQTSADGHINLATYEALGSLARPVKKDTPYFVRVHLTLEKSCLGLAYDFGVQAVQ